MINFTDAIFQIPFANCRHQLGSPIQKVNICHSTVALLVEFMRLKSMLENYTNMSSVSNLAVELWRPRWHKKNTFLHGDRNMQCATVYSHISNIYLADKKLHKTRHVWARWHSIPWRKCWTKKFLYEQEIPVFIVAFAYQNSVLYQWMTEIRHVAD